MQHRPYTQRASEVLCYTSMGMSMGMLYPSMLAYLNMIFAPIHFNCIYGVILLIYHCGKCNTSALVHVDETRTLEIESHLLM